MYFVKQDLIIKLMNEIIIAYTSSRITVPWDLTHIVWNVPEDELPSVMRTLREKLVDFGIANNYIHNEFIPVEIFQKVKGPFHHKIR